MLVKDFQKMLGIRLKMLSAFNKIYKRTPNIKKKELKKAFKNISKKDINTLNK
jgi:hypothetical protein